MTLRVTPWILAALMCSAAIAGVATRPSIEDQPNFLESTVPSAFGEWQEARDQGTQILDPGTQELLRKIYKELLSRTYVNKAGYRIMLSLARSGNQIGVQQAHLPDICYPAQGFKLGTVEDGDLTTPYGPIAVRRLTTSMGSRSEPVTYWLTMANQVVRSRWDKRLVQFRMVLTGQSPDGLLFRISPIDRDSERALAMQQQFAADMMAAVSADARRKLGGLVTPPGAI